MPRKCSRALNPRLKDEDRLAITKFDMEKIGRRMGVSGTLVGYWFRGQRYPKEHQIDALVYAIDGDRDEVVAFLKKKHEEWKEKIRLEDLEYKCQKEK